MAIMRPSRSKRRPEKNLIDIIGRITRFFLVDVAKTTCTRCKVRVTQRAKSKDADPFGFVASLCHKCQKETKLPQSFCRFCDCKKCVKAKSIKQPRSTSK